MDQPPTSPATPDAWSGPPTGAGPFSDAPDPWSPPPLDDGDTRPAAAPSIARRTAALLALCGLLAGAAIVGVLWWSGVLPHRGQPADEKDAPGREPVDVTVQALPGEIMGMSRADLRFDNTEQGRQNAQAYVAIAESVIPEYEKSFGGPGIDVSYADSSGHGLTLTVVNGALPMPRQITDERISQAKGLPAGADPGVLAVERDDLRCSVTIPEMIKDETKPPDELRSMVLSAVTGSARCVRTDDGRDLSVALVSSTKDGPETLQELAQRLAEATDAAWEQIA